MLDEMLEQSSSVHVDSPLVQETVAKFARRSWMQPKMKSVQPTLSANQRTSLRALISYVAHKNGQNDFGVERSLADRFDVPNVMCLPAHLYDQAICYLVDSIKVA